MKPTALVEHAESLRPISDSVASPAHRLQPVALDFGLSAGTRDLTHPIRDTEPPPIDWQSLVIGGAFVLACLGVLASLVR